MMFMIPSAIKKALLGAVIGGALSLSAGAAHAVTPFEQDVATAIDRGLEYLANAGAFNNPPCCSGYGSDASGLPMAALLEKRASGNPLDPPQGYSGANATDKGRLETAAAFILDAVNETSFYAYRDGAWMFALSEYALSSGPDKSVLAPGDADYQTIKEAMDALVDRALANQVKPGNNFTGYADAVAQGYWCYGYGLADCMDSSTTQFVVAGLAAAKAFYSSAASADQAFADAPRVAAINAALALAQLAYQANAAQGDDTAIGGGGCGIITSTERGHGYHPAVEGYPPHSSRRPRGSTSNCSAARTSTRRSCSSIWNGCATGTGGRIWTVSEITGPVFPGRTTCGARSRGWS